jgi:hypothetical protein
MAAARVKRRRFPCGHLGRGAFCHACKDEHPVKKAHGPVAARHKEHNKRGRLN